MPRIWRANIPQTALAAIVHLRWPCACICVCFLSLLAPLAFAADQSSPESPSAEPAASSDASPKGNGKTILDLDIEQLAKTPVKVPSMDIPVTSVTKETSTVGRSPAAIFVITQEMIHRSGATCIPEALRMSPGLEVAQIDSNKWAITCRGFNSRQANKLLVLMDGRTLYNPVTSGVIWDNQDYLMEDIDRIEVIRGPGGTLWGANAVNGVINIITKSAKDTQGSYATVSGGTYEKFADGARYGGMIGDDLCYRVYGKHFERGPGISPTGDANDDWRQGRFGFRADWIPDRDKTDTFTIQGDHYLGTSGTTDTMAIPSPPYARRLVGDTWNTGENVLMRWQHVYDEASDWTLQTYYDTWTSNGPLVLGTVTTYDVDFQYRFPVTDRHSITCGAAFRNAFTDVTSTSYYALHFTPPAYTLNTPSQFVQDEITLSEDLLMMTLGCKLEENPYTAIEYQPTIRLLYTPDKRHSVWGAVSRAVRTPARIDEDMVLTLPIQVRGASPRVFGSHAMNSEAMIAYELGYRTQATDRFSWDIAAFYNVYDHLRDSMPGQAFLETNPPPPHAILPLTFTNGAFGDTYGVELAGNWTVSERWRLYAQYSYLQVSSHHPTGIDFSAGLDPHNQIYLRSSWDWEHNLQFDLMGRWVDELPGSGVPSYITMDLRLGWRPSKQWEFAVVGQNLLQSEHLEFGPTLDAYNTVVTEVPRGVYGTVTWRH